MGQRKDTPKSLMADATKWIKLSSSERSKFSAKFLETLANDEAFATAVLTSAEADDKKELSQLIAKQLGVKSNQVQIDDLDKDVFIKATIATSDSSITICVDTDGKKRCNGGSFSTTYTAK
jgi:hypothetical protein